MNAQEERVEDLIKNLMSDWFGCHMSTEYVNKPYMFADRDEYGYPTSAGRWRALRKFSQDVAPTSVLERVRASLWARAEGLSEGGDIEVMKAVDAIVKREERKQ